MEGESDHSRTVKRVFGAVCPVLLLEYEERRRTVSGDMQAPLTEADAYDRGRNEIGDALPRHGEALLEGRAMASGRYRLDAAPPLEGEGAPERPAGDRIRTPETRRAGIVALVAVSSLLLCSVAFALPRLRPVRFETVAQGAGESSTVTARRNRVIKRAKQWRSLWRALTAGLHPRSRPPTVDFSRYVLLAVTQGRKPTGGYRIAITSVTKRGARVLVRVRETSPGGDCVTPQVVTSPYHVVRARRTRGAAEFRRTRTIRDC
jgi:PrcB C-terminal